MQVRTTTGEPLFRDEMIRYGTLCGVPYRRANQIPTGSSGNNLTSVYCADWSELFMGERSQMIIDTSDQAAYTDNGALVSAWEKNVTLLRGFYALDFMPRHQAAFTRDATIYTTGGVQ